MVVTKPGNAGGATGCRKVETWQPNMWTDTGKSA